MGLFKRKAPLKYDRPRDESVSQVFKKGDTMTKLSFLVFGIGNIVNKQVVRGLIFLALEILYFVYMIIFGISSIGDFITLGTAEQAQVYNEALGIYEYSVGDNSMLCLLYGVITIVLTVGIIFTACMSAKSAYCTQVRKAKGQNIPTFMDDL